MSKSNKPNIPRVIVNSIGLVLCLIAFPLVRIICGSISDILDYGVELNQLEPVLAWMYFSPVLVISFIALFIAGVIQGATSNKWFGKK